MNLCQIPAKRSASDIITVKNMEDIPAALAMSLSCCFSRIKLVAMLRMIKDNPAVQAKYACHPASLTLYWISGLTGAWLKKAVNVREIQNSNRTIRWSPKPSKYPQPAITEPNARDTNTEFIIHASGVNCAPNSLKVFLIMEYPGKLNNGRMNITRSIRI